MTYNEWPTNWFFAVNNDKTFRIVTSCGYVHHYGIFEGLDLLNLTNDLSAVCFRFTSNNVLQDIATKKCLMRRTTSNRQLILTYNCNGPTADTWEYDSVNRYLFDVSMKELDWCFSPWSNGLPPLDITCMPGVSPCSGWNYVTLEPC